jgi:Domain of unknown function (DUF5666)/Domain of unknown function (DUF5667)
MSERVYDALEVCLSALHTGVPVSQCQTIYPDLSEELTPVIDAVQAASSLSISDVPPVAQRQSRSKLWEQAARLERQHARKFWTSRSLSPVRLIIVMAVLLAAVSMNGLALASAQSLPGDVLYPVKRVAEQVTMQLVPAPQIRHQAEMAYIQRRINEVRQLIRSRRVEPVSFEGTLMQQLADAWIVDGVAVLVDSGTHFSGEVSPGALVEIEGTIQPDGHVRAEEVHVRSFQFSGTVISMSRTSWNVNGTKFQMLADTQIDSSVRVGDSVLVLARSEDDNLYYASAITRLSSWAVLRASKTQEPAIQIEWTGTVRSQTTDSWLVGARTVLLSVQSEVKAPIQVGDPVVVLGWLQPDGSLLAEEISLLTAKSAANDEQSSLSAATSPDEKRNYEDPKASQPEQSGSFSSQVQHNQSSEGKSGSGDQSETEFNSPEDSSLKHDSSHTSRFHPDQSDHKHTEQPGDD